MRINLILELYNPEEYSDERMANDIRSSASISGMIDDEEDGSISSSRIDALIVTIPSQTVANAVRFVADR